MSLKFILKGPINPYPEIYKHTKYWKVILVQPQPPKLIAKFPEDEEGLNGLMAEDYVDFLNDKYSDKEINKEWPKINREKRIDYHLNEIKKLKSYKEIYWNEHGNRVQIR